MSALSTTLYQELCRNEIRYNCLGVASGFDKQTKVFLVLAEVKETEHRFSAKDVAGFPLKSVFFFSLSFSHDSDHE